MGYVRSVCLAVAALLATSAQAQQGNETAPVFSLPPASAPPPSNTRQQGPELDVFRAPTTAPVTPPPVIAPTVTPTPTPVPDTAPAPATRRSTPANPAPDTDDRPAPRASEDDALPTPVATPQPEADTPAPAPEANTTAPVDVPAVATVPTATDTTPWPWIISAVLVLLALVAGWLWSRRKGTIVEDALPEIALPEPLAEPLAEPVTEPTPPPAPPEPVAPPPTPPAPEPDAAPRPWLDMDLAITQARYSMIGVTLGYELMLHNRGEQPAIDILVRAVMGNAGAQQQVLLEHFFAGQSGLPLHAAVSILPGETRRISGEMRLNPDQIVPVVMGERSLLIPIIAFDTTYRWGTPDAEPASEGRTARAFIVGQDQDPPAERLAPFRLDQGARQYRRTAARAVAELAPT